MDIWERLFGAKSAKSEPMTTEAKKQDPLLRQAS